MLMLLLLLLTCQPRSLFLGDGTADKRGVRGAWGRPEGDGCAALVSLAHTDRGEGREVVLDCAVNEVAVAGVHRRKQQCSETKKKTAMRHRK